LDDILSYPNDTRHNARERETKRERERESAPDDSSSSFPKRRKKRLSLSLSVSLSFSDVTKKKERERRKSGEKKCEKVRRRRRRRLFGLLSRNMYIKRSAIFLSRQTLLTRVASKNFFLRSLSPLIRRTDTQRGRERDS
jgi:hypothetical protein